MPHYLCLSIKYSLEAMRSLIVPRQKFVLACCILLIFLNLLSCLKANVTNLGAHEHSYHLIDSSHQRQNDETDTAKTTTTIASASEPLVSLRTRDDVQNLTTDDSTSRENPISIVVNDINSQSSSIFQHNEQELKLPQDRTGLLRGASDNQNRSYEISSKNLVTTPSSVLIDDDDLRKNYLENSHSLVSREETTTLSSVDIKSESSGNDMNFSHVISKESKPANTVTDLQALETDAPASITPQILYMPMTHSASIPSPYSSDITQSKIESTRWSGRMRYPNQDETDPAQNHELGEQARENSTVSESLIPNASLLDLLHIIKHLKLINTANNTDPLETIRTLPQNTDLKSMASRHVPQQIIHKQNPIRSLNEGNKHMLQESWQRFVPNQRGSPSEPLATLESISPGRIESSSKVGLKNHLINEQSPSKNDVSKDQALGASRLETNVNSKFHESDMKKRQKLSLMSPYTTNFDSGLDLLMKNLNRVSKPTLKEQLRNNDVMRASQSSSDHITENQSSESLKFDSRITQNKEESFSSPRRKSSKSAINYSLRGNGEPRGKSHRKQLTSNKSHRASSQEIGTKAARTSNKSIQTIEQVTPSSVESTITKEANSNRGERDIVDQTQVQQKAPSERPSQGRDNQVEPSRHKTRLSEATSFDQAQEKHTKKGSPHQIAESQPVVKTPSRPSAQPMNSDHKDSPGLELPPYGNQASPSYVDDPHKKSYYWTSEQAGLYLDGLSDAAQYPQPLTIGELARQHGITHLGVNQSSSGLLTPLFNPSIDSLGDYQQHSLEDFGFSSESELSGDFVNLPTPTNNQPAKISGLPTGPLLNTNGKIDETIKQKIAIKAFEAATRDPGLSAALFGSLLDLGTGVAKDVSDHQNRGVARAVVANPIQYLPTHPSDVLKNLNGFANGQSLTSEGSDGYRDTLPSYQSIMRPNPLALSASPPNHSSMMISMASNIQDSRPTVAAAINLQSGLNSSQPVNLVVTDLVNRWALSRMPDLVPIPLAATVPGYLIRLPDGKILAAALTNQFSIQGIQRGPLTANYRNFINNRLKGLIRTSGSSSPATYKQPPGFLYQGNFMSDSNARPTIVQADAHQQHKPSKSANRGLRGGLLTRAVLSQLGLGTRLGQRQVAKQSSMSKTSGGSVKGANSSGGSRPGRAKIVKLTSSPFPVPALTSQELADLPIADPNEPVFSFTDENQLIDSYHRQQTPTSTRLPKINRPSVTVPTTLVDQTELSPLDLMTSSSTGNLGQLLNIPETMAHLASFEGFNRDNFLNYASRKRKSSTRFPLAKFGSLYHWLTSIRQAKRKEKKSCTERTRSAEDIFIT